MDKYVFHPIPIIFTYATRRLGGTNMKLIMLAAGQTAIPDLLISIHFCWSCPILIGLCPSMRALKPRKTAT
jgi:hypothetical protein